VVVVRLVVSVDLITWHFSIVLLYIIIGCELDMDAKLYPQRLGRADVVVNPAKLVPAGQNKLTRYDIINKNYIFPQDKYTIETNYV
jgi:hypothetical protein